MGKASSKEARAEVSKNLRAAILGSKNEPSVLVTARSALIAVIPELESIDSEHSRLQAGRARQLLVRINRLRFQGIEDGISRISARIAAFERKWPEVLADLSDYGKGRKGRREKAEAARRKFLDWLGQRPAVIDFFEGEMNRFIRPLLPEDEFRGAMQRLESLRQTVNGRLEFFLGTQP